MTSHELVAGAGMAIELVGVGAIALGLVVASVLALRDLRAPDLADVYRRFRQRIGRAILLGLELLVAADIIRTVSEVPSLNRVAVLAGIVGIRTFLSLTLELELTGRPPWAAKEHAAVRSGSECADPEPRAQDSREA